MIQLTDLIKLDVDLTVHPLPGEYYLSEVTINSSDVLRYRGTGYGCVIETVDGKTWHVSDTWDYVDSAWSI